MPSTPHAAIRAKPRVVVLSKPHPLTSYLESRLAAEGYLAGIVYEQRFEGIGDQLRYLRSNARREGLMHTLDVVAYEIFDRATRRGYLDEAASRLLPLSGAHGITATAVRSLNAPTTRELIRQLAPDVIVVHATGILGKDTFSLARTACLNIHCGVLPEYRGHASTFHALHRGDLTRVGVTVHHVAPKVDTGTAVAIRTVDVTAEDDDVTLWCKAFRAGVDAVLAELSNLERGAPISEVPYIGTFGEHYRRRGLTEHLAFLFRSLPRARKAASVSDRP